MNKTKLFLGAMMAMVVAQFSVAGDCCNCPSCGKVVCKPERVQISEKKHCYEVDCKPICVPKIRWPWEKCCKPKCAKVKYINVLRKVEYECKHCGWEWKTYCVDKCACGSSEQQEADAPPVPEAEAARYVPRPVISQPRVPQYPANARQGQIVPALPIR